MRSLLTLRQDARAIFEAGLRAVDPSELVRRSIRRQGSGLEITGRLYDLSSYRSLSVVGAGTASARMAGAMEEIAGAALDDGIVIVKYGHSGRLNKIKVVEAGHRFRAAVMRR